jgi:hypothetical protein
MNRFASRLSCVVCAFISLVAFSERAEAAVRAYSAIGTAQFTGPNTFVGAGNATHLGSYSEAGRVAFSPTADPAVLHVDGSIVYTAANGDELHAVVNGELNGVTGAITATVSYVGGTGRFTSASGSAGLTGQLGAGGTVSVNVAGTIDF